MVGFRWRQVGTQGRRSASVYFRYLDAARAFAKAARRVGVLAFEPTGHYQRLNEAGDPIYALRFIVTLYSVISFRGVPTRYSKSERPIVYAYPQKVTMNLYHLAKSSAGVPGAHQSDGRRCGRVFAIAAARMFLGARLTALSAPLPFGAYPFLAINLLGWAWAHLRTRPAWNAAPSIEFRDSA